MSLFTDSTPPDPWNPQPHGFPARLFVDDLGMRVWVFATFVLVGLISLMGGGLFAVVQASHSACTTRADDLGLESRWGLMAGCRVHVPETNQWIDIDAYRVLIRTPEAK